jgi:hypothetical protein
MTDFDPEERFTVPEETDPNDVLRELLESDGTDEVSDEPDVEESDS